MNRPSLAGVAAALLLTSSCAARTNAPPPPKTPPKAPPITSSLPAPAEAPPPSKAPPRSPPPVTAAATTPALPPSAPTVSPGEQTSSSAREPDPLPPPSPPPSKLGITRSTGRLPPEVIQRTVRQSFGLFRLCYENNLRNSPNLQGRVAVRFIIERDGSVSHVSDGGSDMADSRIVACVVREFYKLSFPPPEGGVVIVTYPIMFSPGG